MSKAVLIALYGSSCTGKTTLAKQLALETGASPRCCGDIVRQVAGECGVGMDDLSAEDHAAIDAETRQWCALGGDRIVEGRFLDQVLAKHPPSPRLILIEVIASKTARAERWARRLNKSQSERDVDAWDEKDAAFRSAAYGTTVRLPPIRTVDTSNRSVDACLEELRSIKNDLSKPD